MGCESRPGWGASLLGQASEQGQVACVNRKGGPARQRNGPGKREQNT